MRRDMTAWLSVLVPLLVMFFALGMGAWSPGWSRPCARRSWKNSRSARPDEVRALFRQRARAGAEPFRLRAAPGAPSDRNKRAA
jgi:hypothetical protein